MKKIILSAIFSCLSFLMSGQESKNEHRALDYIQSQVKTLEINPQHSFKLSFVNRGPAGEILRFQQMLSGVPVLNSEIVVNFNPHDELVYSSNSYDKGVQIIDTNPIISPGESIAIAKIALKFNDTYNFQESKLFVYNKLPQTKLIYKVNIQNNDNPGDWEVIIDAKTSQVISIKDVAVYHHKKDKEVKKNENENSKKESKAPLAFVTGTAMVFASDPLGVNRSAYAGQYVDGNDATNASLNAARISVTLPEIDLTAGVYRLKSTYCDILDFEAPNKGLFTQATSAFNFTRDNDAFEAANSFYHLDNSIRYINQTLGITCRPQQNLGVLIYDPSGLSAADNSHFIPSSDRIAFGEGCVDDAEDADVVWHELGHGLHDWMTNGNANSGQGLGEGSGDYWAQSHSRILNQWLPTDAAYNWMFNWDGHNVCWAGRVTNYTAVYPGGLTGAIHTDGQIWATSLMKIWDIIGRTKTDKAFLSGLALTNSTSTQNQAAIAVRQAGINMNFPCADIQTMTDEFTTTGYTMPAVALRINCPATQTVNADASGNYTVPNYESLSNAISPNCSAIVSQSPAVGSVVSAGTYPVTMTATSGGTATCNFNLVVQPFLATDSFNKKYVSIYPNPASSEVTIKGEIFENETMTVYNMLGQKVMETGINSNEETINISKLSTGVYTIFFNVGKASYKLVKK